MAIDRIDPDRCIGCTQCYLACTADVIRMDDKTGKAVVKYPEDCVVCDWCILSCPVHAHVFKNGNVPAVPFTTWG